jgi:uncharacterized protein YbaP (TraB family)
VPLQLRNARLLILACLCCAVIPVGRALAKGTGSGPILWVVQRGGAKVYIFGFSDAKDQSWFTPTVERAFDQSRELWIETPPPGQPEEAPPLVRKSSGTMPRAVCSKYLALT